MFTKKQYSLVQIILAAWFVFTLMYMLVDLVEIYQRNNDNSNIRYWMSAGKQDTLIALLKEAEEQECNPFEVKFYERQVNLVNAECLSTVNLENLSRNLKLRESGLELIEKE